MPSGNVPVMASVTVASAALVERVCGLPECVRIVAGRVAGNSSLAPDPAWQMCG